MKQIASAYTYDKTSGVISLTGVNIDRDQLLLIVNTTRNVTYYNFADSTTTLQAFTQGANTSITLASSVVSASSAHTNADALTIYYDDQVSSGTMVIDAINHVGNNDGFPDYRLGSAIYEGNTESSPTRFIGVGYTDSGGAGRLVTDATPFPVRLLSTIFVAATDLGDKANAAATTDTGTFSVIAFIKRGLQNWTSLLAKIPTLVSGRIPVDGSGVTQPVSLASSVSTISAQGTTVTSLNFTSTASSSTLISAAAGRRVLTVFNEGAGVLYISSGAICTTTSYQLRIGVGEYWECPSGQLSLIHTAVFATAGTARVTQVT